MMNAIDLMLKGIFTILVIYPVFMTVAIVVAKYMGTEKPQEEVIGCPVNQKM